MASGEVSKKDTIETDETPIVITINNITEELEKLIPTPKSYIFKVNPDQRSVNEKAYEPVVLSIGPYNYHKRNSDQLRYGERQKLRYLNYLIKRKEEKDGTSRSDQLREYLGALEELEGKARSYYAEAVHLEKNEFLKMMLLDGCFIIELFRRLDREECEGKSVPPFENDQIDSTLLRDLILLENQIPFFVLMRLYSITGDKSYDPCLLNMALYCLPNSEIEKGRQWHPVKLPDLKHLLDLVHRIMLGGKILEKKEEGASPPVQKQGGWTNWKLFRGKALNGVKAKTRRRHSAVELRDHGVRFKKAEQRELYNITFEKGLLEIPIIVVDDNTEVLFRNMIAYEGYDHCVISEHMYAKDYMDFMDDLVNTTEDVKLLRCHGIIENLLGDDQTVATMFNEMGKNVVLSPNSYYEKITDDLSDYCKRRRHAWWAKFKEKYLSSPWAISSVIAASILLIFTMAQTVYTALSY